MPRPIKSIGFRLAASAAVALAGVAGAAPPEPLIANPEGRDFILADVWHAIVDPYENGYYNYRYEPHENGYFKNAKPIAHAFSFGDER